MPHITVDDEQARIISGVFGDVEIRDRHGRRIGYVTHGFTEEDIAIAKQRRASGKCFHTTEQVLEHLESLEKDLEHQ